MEITSLRLKCFFALFFNDRKVSLTLLVCIYLTNANHQSEVSAGWTIIHIEIEN